MALREHSFDFCSFLKRVISHIGGPLKLDYYV